MAITKVAQSQTSLVAAFNTILQHCGATPEVLNFLDYTIALCLREINRLMAYSVNCAFASGSTGAANLGAAGAFGVANGGVAAAAGNTFVTTAATDSSDTLLATAKGSAVAVGDLFVVLAGGVTVAFVASGVAGADTAYKPYTYEGVQSPGLAQ